MFDIEEAIWGIHFAEKQAKLDGQPIGPSGAGDCYRAQAYAQLGVPVSNPEDSQKADAGSLVHYGIDTILADVEGVETETHIHIPGLRRRGTGDILKRDEHLLIDIKTYGDRAFGYRMDAGGPFDHQWDQVQLYGLGLYEEAGDGEPWTLQILGINRETGEHQVWEQVQDLDRAREIAAKIQRRQNAISAAALSVALDGVDPQAVAETFPREGKGPGRGFPCNWCAFMDTCWPAPIDPSLSPQSATIVADPEAVAAQAEAYRIGQQMEAEGKRLKYDAAAFLKGIKGTFGDWDVSQSRPGKPSQEPDVEAMIELLASHGETVPMLTKPGRAGYVKVGKSKAAQR